MSPEGAGPRQPEMPAEHALLGLLAMAEGGASHGYDLARQFAEGQPLGEVLRLEPGMLYPHLKKLGRRGWVEAETEERASRPARRIYRLTGAGRDELARWLGEPVSHTREIRLEFLVKLRFARALAPVALAASVVRQGWLPTEEPSSVSVPAIVGLLQGSHQRWAIPVWPARVAQRVLMSLTPPFDVSDERVPPASRHAAAEPLAA